MRCQCCNKNLSDYELTMRHPETGDFTDICVKCLPDTTIQPVVRKDLEPETIDASDWEELEDYDDLEDLMDDLFQYDDDI